MTEKDSIDFNELPDHLKDDIKTWYREQENKDNKLDVINDPSNTEDIHDLTIEQLTFEDRAAILEDGENGIREYVIESLEELRNFVPIYLIEETKEFVYWNEETGTYNIDDTEKWILDTINSYLFLNSFNKRVGDRFHSKVIRKYTRLMSYQYRPFDDFKRFSMFDREKRRLKINFKNGYLTIDASDENNPRYEFREHSKGNFFLSSLTVPYNKDAHSELWLEKVREIVPDKNQRNLLQCFFAYSLIPDFFDWECVLILYGTGNNGKGTILDTWSEVFEKICAAKIHELGNANTRKEAAESDFLYGDESEEAPPNLASIKAIASGSKVQLKKLYKDTYSAKINLKCAFTMNRLEIEPKSTGDKRKLLSLYLPNKFEGKDDEVDLKYELRKEENLQGIINWALEKVPYVINHVRELKKGMSARTEEFYDQLSDTFEMFCHKFLFYTEDAEDKLSTSRIYKAYNSWAKRFGYDTIGKRKISGKVREKYNMQSISLHFPDQGGTLRGFRRLKLDEVKLEKDVPNWKKYKDMSKFDFQSFFDSEEKLESDSDATIKKRKDIIYEHILNNQPLNYDDLYTFVIEEKGYERKYAVNLIQKMSAEGMIYASSKGWIIP